MSVDFRSDKSQILVLEFCFLTRLEFCLCSSNIAGLFSSDGRCEKEVRRRFQEGWMSWKKVSGALCDNKLSARVKGKIYKSVVRPAMLHGMEIVAATERQVKKWKLQS